MRFLRTSLLILLAVTACLYGYTRIQDRISGTSQGPKIRCDGEILQISAKDPEEKLLTGVTASDPQDGDLTDQILIGGISKLITNDTAKVTYLVFDSDHNVTSFVRYVQYTDYERPQLQLDAPLVFQSEKAVSVTKNLKATDVVDGDLSDSVRISTLSPTQWENVYNVVAQVTNSMGDTARLELPVLIQQEDWTRPVIQLTQNLIYLETDSEFDPAQYLHSVQEAGIAVSMESVQITHSVDTGKPGCYWVCYSYTSGGRTGMAFLTVVVV